MNSEAETNTSGATQGCARSPVFLPQEATEVQRSAIMERTFAAGEAQGAIVMPDTRAVYERYIRGECSLAQAGEQAMSVYHKTF